MLRWYIPFPKQQINTVGTRPMTRAQPESAPFPGEEEREREERFSNWVDNIVSFIIEGFSGINDHAVKVQCQRGVERTESRWDNLRFVIDVFTTIVHLSSGFSDEMPDIFRRPLIQRDK